jgi:glycosyltransferase involved in cell wall biosynthesis
MKILIALTYYRPHYSGLTIHAEREARALVARGHQVTVLTSRFDPNLPLRETRDGVEIIRPKVWIHVSKGVIMPSMLYWAWRLARQSDIVHLHVPQLDAAPIAVMARLMGKPVVLSYHCDLQLPSGFVHALANQVSNLANHVSARAANLIVHNTRDYAEHSAFMKNYLEKLYPILPPVEIVPITQADRRAFREKFKITPEQRLIGMAARLATEKGAEYLAEALPLVLQRFPKARVLFVGPYQNVVGEEAYAQHLAPLIKRLGDHWSFLGIVSPIEMSAFFHECEVTVLPSINSTESYGLVQVESMTCGTPVIASDLPGVRVPVKMSGNGQIVPARDAQALATALIEILENPQPYQGEPGIVTRLSTPEAVAEEYEKAFDQARQLAEGKRLIIRGQAEPAKIKERRAHDRAG